MFWLLMVVVVVALLATRTAIALRQSSIMIVWQCNVQSKMKLTSMSRDREEMQVRSTPASRPVPLIAKHLLHADAEPHLTAETIAHLDASKSSGG